MARKPNKNSSARLFIRPSSQVVSYLEQLAELGIHGTTPSEVAKKLIENEVERLIRDEILQLHRSS
jgi:hypothetical protein